jgi:hypothetical protein
VRDASFRLEIDETGPQATLDLPLAALLGIDRWIPLRAALVVGLEGIRLAPHFDSRSVATRD